LPLFGADDWQTIAFTPSAYSKKLPKPEWIYVVDFFCGCGGMSWGFANTRQSHLAFKILLGVDLDRHALSSFRTTIWARTLRKDVRKLAAKPALLTKAIPEVRLKSCHPLVFIGCPPCQGFSAHRKKDQRDDPRNDLTVAFAKLCKHFRPDLIVIENV